MFFATPFDFASVDFLEQFNLPAYKTASADIINTPFLEYIASTGKPMIISTGGASIDDVKRAYEKVSKYNNQISILQCSSVYPVDPSDMNLAVIETYMQEFKDNIIGHSDHQSGIAMALVGYVLGARIIEKHFTLDKKRKNFDHKISCDSKELTEIVKKIRNLEIILGKFGKILSIKEKNKSKTMRRFIVAKKDLNSKTILSIDDLAFKRIKNTKSALEAKFTNKILGKKIQKKIIKKIENIEQIEKNFIKQDYKRNKFKNKKYTKIFKSKKKYNYPSKVRKDNFDSKKLTEH